MSMVANRPGAVVGEPGDGRQPSCLTVLRPQSDAPPHAPSPGTSARWSLNGEIREIALNYVSTCSLG